MLGTPGGSGDTPVRMGTPVGPYLVVIHHAEGVLVARDQVVAVLAQVCGGGAAQGTCPALAPLSLGTPSLTPKPLWG